MIIIIIIPLAELKEKFLIVKLKHSSSLKGQDLKNSLSVSVSLKECSHEISDYYNQ